MLLTNKLKSAYVCNFGSASRRVDLSDRAHRRLELPGQGGLQVVDGFGLIYSDLEVKVLQISREIKRKKEKEK